MAEETLKLLEKSIPGCASRCSWLHGRLQMYFVCLLCTVSRRITYKLFDREQLRYDVAVEDAEANGRPVPTWDEVLLLKRTNVRGDLLDMKTTIEPKEWKISYNKKCGRVLVSMDVVLWEEKIVRGRPTRDEWVLARGAPANHRRDNTAPRKFQVVDVTDPREPEVSIQVCAVVFVFRTCCVHACALD